MFSQLRLALLLSVTLVLSVLFLKGTGARPAPSELQSHFILEPKTFQHYFVQFSADEKDMLGSSEPLPWEWFEQNIPWLDVPDKDLEEIYYFRWYSFEKHIRRTPDGFVIDEFVENVPWAGKFNTINAAAGHHIREARWLRNPTYVEDYTRFWFSEDGEPRRYSFWAADSVYQLYLATGDRQFAINLLPGLERNFAEWEQTHQDSSGLYWQIDDRDGMEFSIGGSGYRPTINSYMYGDAVAISRIAETAGQAEVAKEYKARAAKLRRLIETQLWNPNDEFYETVSREPGAKWSGVRELIGFIPWYFEIPSVEHTVAWKELFDPQGFAGQYGPTTAERRNGHFEFQNPHECLWNGPSWPFATTQTLVALANVLNGKAQEVVSPSDYFRLLSAYVRSQRILDSYGKSIPWIDEDLDPDNGKWIAREILKSRNQPPPNRGRYYNHSGFADLVFTGLLGVRPSEGNQLVLHPLIPDHEWDYFALDALPYHGHLLTIFYDRTGQRYRRGTGLTVLSDGEVVARSNGLSSITIALSGNGTRGQVTRAFKTGKPVIRRVE